MFSKTFDGLIKPSETINAPLHGFTGLEMNLKGILQTAKKVQKAFRGLEKAFGTPLKTF